MGSPQDLLEDGVKKCLEFLLGSRAHRWGADRRFEPLPDGVAVGSSNLILLYDAKAYGGGFNMEADDLRRFGDYIRNFNGKYAHYLGHVYSFLVVSGRFNQTEDSLRERSARLYSECQVQLCFLRTRTLGEIVRQLVLNPKIRPSVDWRKVFADPIITGAELHKQIQAISKDGLIEMK